METTPIQPSAANTQPRRRSSLQFEKQQLEKIVAAMGGAVQHQTFKTNEKPARDETDEQVAPVSLKRWSPILMLVLASAGAALIMTLISSQNGHHQETFSSSNSLQIRSSSQPNLRRTLEAVNLAAEEDDDEVSIDASMIMSEDDEDDSEDMSEGNDDDDDDGEGDVASAEWRDLRQSKKDRRHSLPLRTSDLQVWQRFYTDLQGSNWRMCNSSSNPCNQGDQCRKKIKCKAFGNELRLIGIVLPNNRLSGFVPGRELATLDKLKILDLSNKPTKTKDRNNLRPAVPCFELTSCLQEDITCTFANTDLFKGGVPYCTTAARDVYTSDLVIWQQFFTLTGGAWWTHCADAFADPCTCQSDQDHFVMCEEIAGKLRITAVVLPDNNLKGALASYTQDLLGWTELREIDLSENPELTGCVSIAECDDDADEGLADLQCDIKGTQLVVCDGTETENDGTVPSSTDALPLDPLDQTVWETLYDALNGQFWRRCSGSRSNPCAFSKCVVCQPSPTNSGLRKISEILLADNRMSGELPLEALFQLNMTLESLDAFSSNPQDADTRNIFTNQATGGCIALPINWNVTDSGLVVCEPTAEDLIAAADETDGMFSVQDSLDEDYNDDVLIEIASNDTANQDDDYANELEAQTASSRMSGIPVHPADLQAFQSFYRATHGETWIYCAETFADPCGGCEPDQASFDRIMCMLETDPQTQVQSLRISEITLQNNHLRGKLDVVALNSLPKLSILDLSNAPLADRATNIVAIDNACLEVQVCKETGTFCNFAGLNLELC